MRKKERERETEKYPSEKKKTIQKKINGEKRRK